jgi:hypothetical protein
MQPLVVTLLPRGEGAQAWQSPQLSTRPWTPWDNATGSATTPILEQHAHRAAFTGARCTQSLRRADGADVARRRCRVRSPRADCAGHARHARAAHEPRAPASHAPACGVKVARPRCSEAALRSTAATPHLVGGSQARDRRPPVTAVLSVAAGACGRTPCGVVGSRRRLVGAASTAWPLVLRARTGARPNRSSPTCP